MAVAAAAAMSEVRRVTADVVGELVGGRTYGNPFSMALFRLCEATRSLDGMADSCEMEWFHKKQVAIRVGPETQYI